MITIDNKINCCGCSACEQTCPVHAITMRRDKLGFDYPVVNEKACINCKACDKVCPIKNEFDPRIPSHVYAVKNKNKEERMASSSGGVFSILAKDTLAKGGTVYGAAFDDKWNVHPIRINTIKDLHFLQGSKYVQSKIGTIYKQVKNDLQNGRKVLFSGTPCQIAALQKFLKHKHPNLTTVDVACHGVPNPRIWENFLKEQTKSDEKIKNIFFRDKSTGWNNYSFRIDISEKTYTQKVWEHTYMLLFLHNFILRPSCHSCHFRNGKSNADYTMCDYWSIERNHPNFFDENGVGALITYNQDLPQCMLCNSELIETNYKDLCYGNPALINDWPRNKDSKLFYFLHNKIGFSLNTSLKIGLISMYIRAIPQKSINLTFFVARKLLSYVKWQK